MNKITDRPLRIPSLKASAHDQPSDPRRRGGQPFGAAYSATPAAQAIGREVEAGRDPREQPVADRPAQPTAGPWAVEGEGAHVARLSHTYEITAPLVGRMARPDYEQIMADARLVASAPDLLAALKLAESVYRLNVVAVGEPSSVLDAMQAAIAKAEGR